jgi:hypothetical protein
MDKGTAQMNETVPLPLCSEYFLDNFFSKIACFAEWFPAMALSAFNTVSVALTVHIWTLAFRIYFIHHHLLFLFRLT